MRPIDIIGGSGFIGTRLVKRLQNRSDCTVRIIDKVASAAFPHLTSIADVRDSARLTAQVTSGAVIINLAAEHRDDVQPRSLYDQVNVDGARNVCATATSKDVRTIVFTSSVAVYGFAPIDTDETGAIAPFNDYGRTKHEAEQVFTAWQRERPGERTLVIIRPTVVFGENNRGNVYNLLRQLASRAFVMVGPGTNRKSMAYVENVAAFIEHCMSLRPGIHVANYIDKPDMTMNELVSTVRRLLGKSDRIRIRLPYTLGCALGRAFDLAARVSGKRFAISSIRVRKFCSDSAFASTCSRWDFVPPVTLPEALAATVRHEFLTSDAPEQLFYSE
jgi:nucleoside-diphosphate-sugar epimerase